MELSDRRFCLLSFAILSFTNLAAFAYGPPGKTNSLPDKSPFHLLNPTPLALMREFSTDRPDKTESPYTVDAGHFQLEMDWVNYSYNRYNLSHANVRAETFSYATVNLKVGLCNNADFQLIAPTYYTARTHEWVSGKIQNQSDFGDLVARAKINFWGNDDGATAFAAMPFLKLPTSQDHLGNGAFEGGIIFPLALHLPHQWAMGAMTEIDFNEDQAGRRYHAEFINLVTCAHSLIGKMDGYVEFFSSFSGESRSEWIGTADVGFVYALTENVQPDAGINFGVTRAADDLNPFTGISFRF